MICWPFPPSPVFQTVYSSHFTLFSVELCSLLYILALSQQGGRSLCTSEVVALLRDGIKRRKRMRGFYEGERDGNVNRKKKGDNRKTSKEGREVMRDGGGWIKNDDDSRSK